MLELLLMGIIQGPVEPPQYHGDAWVICGPELAETCLVEMDRCLRRHANDGVDPDLAFEWCEAEYQEIFPWEASPR